MVDDGWSAALVLGGIRSGKSAFAESLVAGAQAVRYVLTEELSDEPERLAALLTEAKPDETLLVDDLGGWVGGQLGRGAEALAAAVNELAEAVQRCAARLVIVSPEVGLSMIPATAPGRAFADELGLANRVMAAASDLVVLVVAGQPTWLKAVMAPQMVTSGPRRAAGPAPELIPAPALTPPQPVTTLPEDGDVLHEPTLTLPALSAGLVIQPGMDLPLPDEESGPAAAARLRTLDVPGGGLGALSGVVEFAARTQYRTVPRPWDSVRVLLVHGDHAGGASAGEDALEAARRAREAAEGQGPFATLLAETGASLQIIPAPPARPFEVEDALTAVEVDRALGYGWRLAEDAADAGVDLLVIASCGAGADTAAAAITVAITGAEGVAMLGRVPAPDGRFDDGAWMIRCAAMRDALHRTRARPRGARDLLAALGGGDIAIVTGVLLGAASRRTPVLLDGPVGVAAGLVSRDIGGQARHWCLLPDHGGHPAVRHGADVLGLPQVLDLRLGLGEGATALATLPLLRTALILAGTLAPRSRPHGSTPVPAAPAAPAPSIVDVGRSTRERGDQEEIGRPTSAEEGDGPGLR